MALEGTLYLRTLTELRVSLQQWQRRSGHARRTLDLGKLSGLDTPGALFLCGLGDKGVELTGVRPEHKALLDLICGLEIKPLPRPASVPRWRQLIIGLGKGADGAWRDTIDVITFMGRAASAVGHALIHPHSLRPASISRQVAETGINALPIVGLIAIMISIVIGYQGVAQLRP